MSAAAGPVVCFTAAGFCIAHFIGGLIAGRYDAVAGGLIATAALTALGQWFLNIYAEQCREEGRGL